MSMFYKYESSHLEIFHSYLILKNESMEIDILIEVICNTLCTYFVNINAHMPNDFISINERGYQVEVPSLVNRNAYHSWTPIKKLYFNEMKIGIIKCSQKKKNHIHILNFTDLGVID